MSLENGTTGGSPSPRHFSAGLFDLRLFAGYFPRLSSQEASASKRVTKTDSIEVGEVDGSQWVRVHGKGNFTSSPRLKKYVEGCLAEGCEAVVVDLDECPAMDSTFMGTLAGLAGRLLDNDGSMTVVGLSERNRDSLVDLGLDAILELEEEDGASAWSENLEEIREGLQHWDNSVSGAAVAEEVLEAHRKLCEVDGRNNEKFGAVLEVLEQECSNRKN